MRDYVASVVIAIHVWRNNSITSFNQTILFRCNRPFWDCKKALLDRCQEDDHEQGHQYINYIYGEPL
jgi:hypothetical protein